MYTKNHYIYDVIERLNSFSDDSELSIEHISFLIDEVRALVIKQSYQGLGASIPRSIKQQINTTLTIDQENEFISLDKCLCSENALPTLIESSIANKYLAIDNGSYKNVKFIRVPNERFPYTGLNKYLQNIVYYTLGVNSKLYFNSGSDVYKLISEVRVFGVFLNPEAAWKLGPDYSSSTKFNDTVYPIDADMWVRISDILIKILIPKLQAPEDKINNAND